MASVVATVMSAVYISSVVGPPAHLRGLPAAVVVVNNDLGATIGLQHLDAREPPLSQSIAPNERSFGTDPIQR
jgi:hypothetical protein